MSSPSYSVAPGVSKGSLVYNVKDYGATGDGSTDDITAINNAVSAIPTNGAILYFPPGVYRTSGDINLKQGMRVLGSSAFTSQIRALSGYSGTAILNFQGTTAPNYFETGAGVENIIIDGNNQSCHNISMQMGQDQVKLIDVKAVNTNDSFNTYRFVPDSRAGTTVSQTITCIGCTGIHKNATATAPTWYFQRCNETVLINCKGWGGPTSATTNSAWQFEGCSGMVMQGCSAALADTGISITSQGAVSNVSSVGHSYYGLTFEAIGTTVLTTSADSGLVISALRLDNPRHESLPTQNMIFNNLSLSTIDAASRPVTLNSSCDSNHIFTNDTSKITNSGTNTSIIGWDTSSTSGITFSPGIKVTGSLVLQLVSKTGTYAILRTDNIILCDATSAAFTATLPTAVNFTGQTYTIKKTDSSVNAVTVGTTSSQTIDGSTTAVISTQYASITVVSDGANWSII